MNARTNDDQFEALSKLAHQIGAGEAINEVLRWAHRYKSDIPAKALEELAAIATRLTAT